MLPSGVAAHPKPHPISHHRPPWVLFEWEPLWSLRYYGVLAEMESNNYYVLVIQDYFTNGWKLFPYPMSRLQMWLKCWPQSGCTFMEHHRHGTATEVGSSSLKCSRKWARCSVSRTSTPRPSNFNLMTRMRESCHYPLCCNGLQSNKAQCKWFHAQLHDVWQRSE